MFSLSEFVSQRNIQIAGFSVLVLLAVFLFAKVGTELKNWMNPSLNYASISVEGQGKVTAVPNIASVSFSVLEENKDVAVAQKAATEKINTALAFVKEQGIEDKDVKTEAYSISPQYDWVQTYCAPNTYCAPGKQVIRGYQISQSVTVKVRNTEKVGELLAGLGERGITQVYGPNFEVDDVSTLKEQARVIAIKDATEKAKVLAKNLRVRLVRVTGFWENTDPSYPMAYGMGAADGVKVESVPSLPTGENEIKVVLNVSYEIR